MTFQLLLVSPNEVRPDDLPLREIHRDGVPFLVEVGRPIVEYPALTLVQDVPAEAQGAPLSSIPLEPVKLYA